jgi:hypothetical protein
MQRRVADNYKRQQENIQKAGQYTTELLKGIKQGESIYNLFLQAVNIIGLMTGDTVIHSQAAEDLKAIYGEGLLQPEPLIIELQEIRQRLEKLSAAISREDQPDDTLRRIYAAIAQHKTREQQIMGLIGEE